MKTGQRNDRPDAQKTDAGLQEAGRCFTKRGDEVLLLCDCVGEEDEEIRNLNVEHLRDELQKVQNLKHLRITMCTTTQTNTNIQSMDRDKMNI